MLSTSRLFLQQRVSFLSARKATEKGVNELPEIFQANKFITQLQNADFSGFTVRGGKSARPIEDLSEELPEAAYGATVAEHKKKLSQILDSAFATFTLHIESRVANLLGKGFYTIGPCGEELLAPIGLVLRPTDPVALHYRHLAPSIARRLSNSMGDNNNDQILNDILLDRAKGYTVASTDPICGGHHCCLGGNEHDFLVTSTLASQSCPALGRAMGISLSNKLLAHNENRQQQELSSHPLKRKQDFEGNINGDLHVAPFPKDAVSFVTLGDGSVNNGHFLSAMNLADFTVHKKFKAPIVFCVTDNNMCISLKGNNYMERFVENAGRFPTFTGHGSDAIDTWIASHRAVQQARKTGRPQLLVLNDITRRFGHAATDRQNAYMSRDEILEWQNRNPLLGFCKSLVDANLYTGKQLSDRFQSIWESTKLAFEAADKEPKISSREQVSAVNSAPAVNLNLDYFGKDNQGSKYKNVFVGAPAVRDANTHVMRKHMTRIFDELLTEQKDVVYIGEDVEHGGYYLVTDGLKKKHPMKVLDFPPDETSLIGAGMGFSQAGLTPIVEIPYAKYLDCGFDLFTEACLMHWLSKGKEANGMILRLQGFGRGVFGGNYHTHNMLHIPPGLDVVCCSRGDDYAKLMRYSIQQARAGRLVMFVDPTELLNLREIRADVCWEFPYSDKVAGDDKKKSFYDFDDVTVYRTQTPRENSSDKKIKKVAIVTYGNGLIAALEADIANSTKIANFGVAAEVDVIDCRLLSAVPEGLKQTLTTMMVGDGNETENNGKKSYDAVLFADPCKFGQHPLGMHYQWFVNWATDRKTDAARNFPLNRMKCIGAEFTYNPLGNKLTFLNASDIEDGLIPLLRDD